METCAGVLCLLLICAEGLSAAEDLEARKVLDKYLKGELPVTSQPNMVSPKWTQMILKSVKCISPNDLIIQLIKVDKLDYTDYYALTYDSYTDTSRTIVKKTVLLTADEGSPCAKEINIKPTPQ